MFSLKINFDRVLSVQYKEKELVPRWLDLTIQAALFSFVIYLLIKS
jgi:hypothetical protein